MRLVGLSQPYETEDGKREGMAFSTMQVGDGKTQKVLGTICPMTGLQMQNTRFSWDLAIMLMWNHENLVNDEQTVFYHQPGFGFASSVRNEACQKFLSTEGGDWLLFLDTDNTFPMDIVKRMLDSQQQIAAEHGACDILTGLYFKKWPPFQPLAYQATENSPFEHMVEYPEVPFEVSGCGAGCLMIQKPVLERIGIELRIAPFGWVGELHNQRSALWMEKYARNFTTEDFPFNLRCAMLGYKTWCDPRIKLGHVTLCEVTEQDFFQFREKIREQQVAEAAKIVPEDEVAVVNPLTEVGTSA